MTAMEARALNMYIDKSVPNRCENSGHWKLMTSTCSEKFVYNTIKKTYIINNMLLWAETPVYI